MITVLIRKDDATEVSRQVAGIDAARALITEGMPVFVLHDDGSKEPVTVEAAPIEAEAASEPLAESEAPAADEPAA